MSDVMLGDLLQSVRRGRRRLKLTPKQAREELDQWLGYVQSGVEQAGASPAQLSALTCLRRAFLGVLAALADPRIVKVGERKQTVVELPFPRTRVIPELKARVDVSEDMLFEQLRGAAEALDKLLALQVPPPPRPGPWTEDDKVLDQLQPLFGALATRNGEAAIAELDLLAERLRVQGVEMVLATGDTADWFSLYDGDDDGYVTVTPAIAVRGELRRRGEARRPREVGQPADMAFDTGDITARPEGSGNEEEHSDD
jgi:hypothetical protein